MEDDAWNCAAAIQLCRGEFRAGNLRKAYGIYIGNVDGPHDGKAEVGAISEKTLDGLIKVATLEGQALTQTVARLRQFIDLL